MPKEKHRLGGMALANGVLVHGPTSWACAVRADDGELKVVARKKRLIGSRFRTPLLRGPAKLAESVAFLPELKQALPEAQLPFARRSVAGAVFGSVVLIQGVRRTRLSAAAQELVAGLLSLAPAVLSLREGEIAAYHGAEHITIGTYEHGTERTKEHERCGTHLVGPLIATSAVANAIASKAPLRVRSAARTAASLGALAATTEIFAWMQRHPDHPLARALAKPGHEFQQRVATQEPTREQLEVAEAALRACLELEDAA